MKESLDNKIFRMIVLVIVLLLAALCILPFVNLLATSLSSADAVNRGEVLFWPVGLNTNVYRTIINDGSLIRAMKLTIGITVVYVALSLVMTVLCAYPLSEPGLKGKKYIWPFILFTMYFSGGAIPSYLLMNSLGLIDSLWVLILPGMLSTYNMIVMRTFFTTIPSSLKESAVIDGAGDFTILTRIVLPLSKPVLATIALFYAVSRWNAVSDALIYINSPKKAVLQIRLRALISGTEAMTQLLEGQSYNQVSMTPQTIRAGSLLFSLIPVLIIYPFLQKYFVKGVMIGAVKG